MRIFLIILTVITTSCFYFPFEFTFLPPGLNTKLMLAVVGIIVMAYHMISIRKLVLSKEIVISSIIALLFSLVGLISVDINATGDYSYAYYLSSMWVWLMAAYVTCTLMAITHKYLSARLIVDYLVVVCVLQVFLALAIDFNPGLKLFVDRYITMGITEFLNEVDRLYGIGAALDVAGIRFSVVLIMIAVLLIVDKNIHLRTKEIVFYIVSFALIAGIGNMMSRTTSVGMAIGIGFLFLNSNLIKSKVEVSVLRFWRIALLSILFIITVGIYFYHTDEEFYKLIRFGFEGFFNWVEKGEWYTDSTDKLNNEMWIWPEGNDTRTWLIGKALFADWHAVGTDIGYCRFVFYCGTIGLTVFTIFFAYLSFALWNKFKYFKYFFLLLFVLGLINWIKVSTDLFLVYALFLSMSSPYLYDRYYKPLILKDENSL